MDDIASENPPTPALPLSHRLGATQGHLLLLPPHDLGLLCTGVLRLRPWHCDLEARGRVVGSLGVAAPSGGPRAPAPPALIREVFINFCAPGH